MEAASANKLQLLRALAQDASIGGERASDWYYIAEAGFNFIDDQCRTYFDELFFLDRRAERIKTGLVVADKTTAAILAVTGATTPTMNIVAQAFGFAVHATDLIAGTYLYRLPPATTQGFVTKMQSAYRRGASRNRMQIDSPTAAYHSIQRYLDLCLPPRIEAEIAKQISGTTARAVIGDGSTVDIETGSVTAPESFDPRVLPMGPFVSGPRAGTRAPVTAGTQVGTKPPRDSKPDASDPEFPGADKILSQFDPKVHRTKFMTTLQDDLCVPASERGAVGEATRALIEVFEDEEYVRVPAKKDKKLSNVEITLIQKQRACASSTGLNYYEKKKYTQDADGTNALNDLVASLKLTSVGADIQPGATLNGLRDKIRAVRELPDIKQKLRVQLPATLAGQVTRDLVMALPKPK